MTTIEKPYTVNELQAMENGEGVKAVISYPWKETGHIDTLNEKASELITGDDCALEDIGYRLVGADIENQEVFIEVTGTVANWLAEQQD